MRLSAPQLRGDGRGTVAFRARLQMVEGVTAAELNPLTGSVTVHHDGQPGTRERILRRLEELLGTPAAAPARPGGRIVEMVTVAPTERLTRRPVPAVAAPT